jgi:hypothetical protein
MKTESVVGCTGDFDGEAFLQWASARLDSTRRVPSLLRMDRHRHGASSLLFQKASPHALEAEVSRKRRKEGV